MTMTIQQHLESLVAEWRETLSVLKNDQSKPYASDFDILTNPGCYEAHIIALDLADVTMPVLELTGFSPMIQQIEAYRTQADSDRAKTPADQLSAWFHHMGKSIAFLAIENRLIEVQLTMIYDERKRLAQLVKDAQK